MPQRNTASARAPAFFTSDLVHERVSAQGEILVPFDLESARAPLEDAYHAGIRAVAIVFLHGYRYPEHERQAAALAREIGFT